MTVNPDTNAHNSMINQKFVIQIHKQSVKNKLLNTHHIENFNRVELRLWYSYCTVENIANSSENLTNENLKLEQKKYWKKVVTNIGKKLWQISKLLL